LSHNFFNDRSGTVIAVAITSQPTNGWLSVDHGAIGYQTPQKILGKDQPDSNPFYETDTQKNSQSV
jgi:hypothetical protein